MSERDEKILSQPLSYEELEQAQGGSKDPGVPFRRDLDDDLHNCTQSLDRDIYGGKGFPNCAATVEEGSLCGENDACMSVAVNYQNMKTFACFKAWK